MANGNPTGYGPSQMSSQRFSRLLFDGDERTYELWETRFLAHLELRGLSATIKEEPQIGEGEDANALRAADVARNAQAYAELVQVLDNKSLSLVMREAAGDGRKAMKILRGHYAGKGKPRVVSLYCELASLHMQSNETVTEYIVRAETIFASLSGAEENISDGLQIGMVVKGLPDLFKPFVVHVTQTSEELTFSDFKAKLRSYEDTERYKPGDLTEDNVMRAAGTASYQPRGRGRGRRTEPSDVECWKCHQRGHISRTCPYSNSEERRQGRWSGTPRRGRQRDSMACVTGEEPRRGARPTNLHGRGRQERESNREDWPDSSGDNRSYCFALVDGDGPSKGSVNTKGIMVDCGATSHMISDYTKFKTVDKTFKPENHVIELADGTKVSGVAKARGEAEIALMDSKGHKVTALLKNALYIPTFPQDIFSVRAATLNGAELHFKKGDNWMSVSDTTRFNIEVCGKLYYLPTITDENNDELKVCHDIQTWHRILGHCNFEDVSRLENVAEGMKIRGKCDKSSLKCDVCIEGKTVETRNKNADSKATEILALVHTDLCGPMDPTDRDGYRFTLAFTDDYSGMIWTYFLKTKSDTARATEKFLADVAPYGNVKIIRSDNGTEYTGKEFQDLLRKNRISHQTSAPYSPHQNGTAERQWRTLFDMGRCMLLESKLPKKLWRFAVQTAAQIRNRCYCKRLGETPYGAFTGKTPNIAHMMVFGTECYAYKPDKKKLDPRCEKGIFIGYDKYSPAYNVYFPQTGRVSKYRQVKPVSENVQLSTNDESDDDYDDTVSTEVPVKVEQPPASQPVSTEVTGESGSNIPSSSQSDSGGIRRYPDRERRPPNYYRSYQCKTEDVENEQEVDYFYRAVYEVPKTYTDAINSDRSQKWVKAMEEEMTSLKENETFTLCTLPKGKRAVGGRWVFTVKETPDQSDTFKARYVAKGYSQVEGIDYKETFSPTASMTSVRALMQIAVQNDLVLHQMDVKTAYLHAPIDCEVYIEQPEGFEEQSETNEHLVCRLNKSLYGLKQSGRNWNKLLHDHLMEKGFEQNAADNCVYVKQSDGEIVILITWVDDLLIATSSNDLMSEVKGMLAERFNMKDLGPLRHFLGIDFTQHKGEVKMSQRRHIEKILKRFGMSDCKPRMTPCELKPELDGEGEILNVTGYREIVGCLIYIMTTTRPDLSWVVSKLSQYLAQPKQQHWDTAKQVLRYLKGTSDFELCYQHSDQDLKLEGYSDADWASDSSDRRSTTGYCFSLTSDGPVISWKSRKQPTVALSTCEAEYMALASAVQESMYLVQLLHGLDKNKHHTPVLIYEDNQGTIELSKNPVCRQRSKHIDVKYHFVRSAHVDGKVKIQYCPTEHMLADVLTKPLTKPKFEMFKCHLFGRN